MPANKRDILLDTAERLFYAEGFHATGIDRVVAEAGVARMTLYNHFPSKEELIMAVLARRHDRYLDTLRQAIAKANAGEAVMALAMAHCQWLESTSNRGCIVIKAIGEFEEHSPAIANQGRQLKHDMLATIGEALSRDGQINDLSLAERLLIVLEGTDALVPVLSAATVTDHLQKLLPAVLAGSERRTIT
ncbi:transcriptional regulator [Halorhodospira halochloris]|uniref:Transcriptional regulator n=1 Tax=Halorhodospira halochloris TaxID=1052 RepID=A0A0X8X8U8_HALHR|nr:TetR/AcrR family transcriptional regulator [Halorhodospira halochloris]MBK1651343.1 TetR family transcriptional regulator [Halorhodospira halochloris]BAU57629.2 transcriptional regulator [Halorhodospira halochloris]